MSKQQGSTKAELDRLMVVRRAEKEMPILIRERRDK